METLETSQVAGSFGPAGAMGTGTGLRICKRTKRKEKLALLLNMVAPYRLPIYEALTEEFDVLALQGGIEPNRNWSENAGTRLKVRRVWTLQINLRKKSGVAGIVDRTYVHLTLGLPWSLIRFRPGIIVSIEMGPRTLIALLYSKLTGVPLWVWWGGTSHSEKNIGGWKRRLRRLIARNVSRWISYGATSTEYLESIGVARAQILQIQNCIPQETFLAVPEKVVDRFAARTRPAILTVGQLIQRKGMDKLIEASGRLKAQGHAFSLTLIGSGPDRDRLADLAREHGVTDFEILPDQPQAVLNEFYRSADVFVFPTMEDVWGLVVNEAIWAGLPVLCSKYAGCAPEVAPEAQVFDPMEPESFDAALKLLIEGRVRRTEPSRLKTWQEVAETICQALLRGSPQPAAIVDRTVETDQAHVEPASSKSGLHSPIRKF